MSSSKITPDETLSYDQMISEPGLYKIVGPYNDVRVLVQFDEETLWLEESGVIGKLAGDLWELERFIKCNDIISIMFSPNLDNDAGQ